MKRFRSFGTQIESDVAQGQHEPDACSAFELDQIQRSKLHGIQQAPASSPRVLLVNFRKLPCSPSLRLHRRLPGSLSCVAVRRGSSGRELKDLSPKFTIGLLKTGQKEDSTDTLVVLFQGKPAICIFCSFSDMPLAGLLAVLEN